MARQSDRRDTRLPAGVDRHSGGPQKKGAPWCYRVELMVHGQRIRQRFEPETPLSEISDWIREQRASVKEKVAPHEKMKGTFEADVEIDYLPQVAHRASIKERTIDIRRWATLFKGRRRNTVKPIEIGSISALGRQWGSSAVETGTAIRCVPSLCRHRR